MKGPAVAALPRANASRLPGTAGRAGQPLPWGGADR